VPADTARQAIQSERRGDRFYREVPHPFWGPSSQICEHQKGPFRPVAGGNSHEPSHPIKEGFFDAENASYP
jgi:hypothetical protein